MKNLVISLCTGVYIALICVVSLYPTSTLTLPPVTQDSPQPSLIVFSATWCGPCQLAKPTVNAIEASGFKVTRYDVDQDTLAARNYSVNGVPDFIIVEPNGHQRAGTHDIGAVKAYFNTYLPVDKKL